MNAVLKLIVPISLGLAAGGLNWWILEGQVAPQKFVKVNKNVGAGRPLDDTALESLSLSGDVVALAKAAVPYAERAVLFNRLAGRDLHEGDIVLWSDASPPPATTLLANEGEEAMPVSLEGISIVPRLLQVGDQVGFLINRPVQALTPVDQKKAGGSPVVSKGMDLQYVGPFRLLSVGERLGRRAYDEKTRSAGSGDERVITVAIKRGPGGRVLDGDSQALVEATDGMHNRRESGSRVVSILLRPSLRTPKEPAPEPLKTAKEGG